MKILYLSSWRKKFGSSGGHYKLYQHVDFLNQMGYDAFVVHTELNLRYPFYPRNERVPVLYMEDDLRVLFDLKSGLKRVTEGGTIEELPLTQDDLLVIKSEWVPFLIPLVENLHLFAVIFNQNAYLSFQQSFLVRSYDLTLEKNPFSSPHILGTILVSNQNQEFLQQVFPHSEFHSVRLSSDPTLFFYQAEKKRQIAYMARKRTKEVTSIVHTIKARNFLPNWDLRCIRNASIEEVASILRESAIFLSFAHQEGFGLPLQEALLCGAAVVGYHGFAGKEIFRSAPLIEEIREGDTMQFVSTVEQMALKIEENPSFYQEMEKKNAEYVLNAYNEEQEREDLKQIFAHLIKKKSDQPVYRRALL